MNVDIHEIAFAPKHSKEKYPLVRCNHLILYGKDNKREMPKRQLDNLFGDIVYLITGFLFRQSQTN